MNRATEKDGGGNREGKNSKISQDRFKSYFILKKEVIIIILGLRDGCVGGDQLLKNRLLLFFVKV